MSSKSTIVKSKTNILHFVTGIGLGGAEKVVWDLCRFSDRENFQVMVLAIVKTSIKIGDFNKENIQLKELNLDKSIFGFIKGCEEVSQFVRDNKIDIIHAHMFHPLLVALLIKLFKPSIKIVFTPHNFNIGSKIREFITGVTKEWRAADILFSKNMYKGIYRKNAFVIPNGISVKDFELELPKFKKNTFLCIGRLEKAKNQIALIKPVKELKTLGYQFQLFLVGDGQNRDLLEDAIRENQLEDYIFLLGNRRDIPALCKQAHCLLIPSLWEGLPIVLLEAGASSLPVISTNVGSIASVIDEGNGYLIADTTGLKDKMKEVMDCYEIAQEKGDALYQRIKNQYDIETIVKKHEVLYNKLLPTFSSKSQEVITVV